MEKKLENDLIFEHLKKRLGMFSIATRFKRCKNRWEILKIISGSQIDYGKNTFDHPDFKNLVEIQKKKFLLEHDEWNFDDIFSYLSNLEKEGILCIGTPFGLIDEILDKIPEDYLFEKYLSDGLRILDPACGRGRFLLSMKRKLINIGLSENEAIECLYGIDIDPKSALITAALVDPKNICEKTNIYCTDTLNKYPKELKNMKFDVIVGNIPFNNDKKAPIWQKFVDISFNKLEKNGIFAMVMPQKWVLPGKNGGIDVFGLFKKANSLVFNIGECSKYFKEGYDDDYFSYVIISNNEYRHSTEIVTEADEFNLDIDSIKWFPYRNITKSSVQLVNKISQIAKNKCKFESKYEINHSPSLKEQPEGEFTYPLFMGLNRAKRPIIKYSNHKDKDYGVPKIIMHCARHGTFDRRIYIDYKGTTTCKRAHVYYFTKGDNVDWIKSKLHRFLIYCLFSSTTTIATMSELPELDKNRSWTDQEIYEYFDLTKEEIELIEKTIKD